MTRISKKLGLAIGGCLIASAIAVIAIPRDLNGPPGGTPVTGPATAATQPQQTHGSTNHSSPTLPADTEVTQPVPQDSAPPAATQPAATDSSASAGQTDDVPLTTENQTSGGNNQEDVPAVSVPDPFPGLDSAEASFPLALLDGALVLETPFSFDGINPDADGIEAKNIAALTLTNVSAQHLVDAELFLVTRDGAQIRFHVGQVPPGGRALLFSTDNQELPPQDQWDRVYYRATSTTAVSLLGSSLDVQILGTQITLTNTTGTAIPPFDLYCHDLLGEEYFGGKVYQYQVNEIKAGQSTIVYAADSLLGMVDAVFAGQITE